MSRLLVNKLAMNFEAYQRDLLKSRGQRSRQLGTTKHTLLVADQRSTLETSFGFQAGGMSADLSAAFYVPAETRARVNTHTHSAHDPLSQRSSVTASGFRDRYIYIIGDWPDELDSFRAVQGQCISSRGARAVLQAFSVQVQKIQRRAS